MHCSSADASFFIWYQQLLSFDKESAAALSAGNLCSSADFPNDIVSSADHLNDIVSFYIYRLDWYCSPADTLHFISAGEENAPSLNMVTSAAVTGNNRCLPAFYEIDITQILLAEPLGSLAFKMVQVRQLKEEQQVDLESADGWRCVYPRPTFSVS
ncbi:hypothetical protein F511_11321 [Dorcoceras hygrometricum]|uniref:Uncharacterized protein n=1 Tax=Dorcoceras hygrometricum TaxID=472368 RepID=A0A2Z7BZC7_9LAMI|nr:hypothetical protein F511_11321 [Dorcoceras hygrometricum]